MKEEVNPDLTNDAVFQFYNPNSELKLLLKDVNSKAFYVASRD